MKNKKRFIAGATCQACGQVDSLLLEIDGELETVTCVDCGAKMLKPKVIDKNKEQPELIATFNPNEN